MDPSPPNMSAHSSTGLGAANMPTPPSMRELEILRRMLGALPSSGAKQLLDQLRMLQVASLSDEAMRIYLLHPDAPRSTCSRDARSKVTALPVRSPQGRVLGEIALWVDHGHLCALQYVRYDARPALMLPDPDWIELPRDEPPVPMSVCVRGAREALLGVRVLRDAPRASSAAAPGGVRMARSIIVALALLLFVAALAAAAFWLGRSGGADLAAARAAGTSAGSLDGAAHGEVAGGFTGSIEGELAGRASTWQGSHDSARARTLVVARRAAVARRKAAQDAAAAAAAEAVPVNYGTCPGYRDSRGFWICP